MYLEVGVVRYQKSAAKVTTFTTLVMAHVPLYGATASSNVLMRFLGNRGYRHDL